MSTQGDTHRRSRRRWRRTSSSLATGAVVTSLLVLSPGQADAAGTTLTVDPSAARCLTTPFAPRASATDPYCTINEAYNAAVTGDTISVTPGTYNERVNVTTAGITFVGTEATTIITGDLPTPQLYGFKIAAPDVVVDGFTFIKQTGASAAGLLVDGSGASGADNAVIRNVTVTDSANNGIRATGTATVPLDNITITNATVSGSNRVGILLEGVTNSNVSHSTTDGNQREGVGIHGGSDDTVENVTSYGNDSANDGATTRLAPGINVTNWQPSAGAALMPASNITIQRNTSYGNDDSGIQVYGGSQNITVGRNLLYNNGDHGIDISQASVATVVSNTVVHNYTAGINIESDNPAAPTLPTGSIGTVRDNISMDNGYGDRTGSDIRVDIPSSTIGTGAPGSPHTTIDRDLVYNTDGGTVIRFGTGFYSTLDGTKGLHADYPDQEMNGIVADPMLDASKPPTTASTFIPLAGSPAIDAAYSNVRGFLATDLNGNAPVDDPAVQDTGAGTPAFADLGALERTTVPANQPPTAKLTASPSTVTAGGTVTLDAHGSADPENGKLGYAFDCGAAGVTAAAGQSASTATCTYPTAGSYTAKVTVTDDGGLSSSATAPITVNVPAGGGGGGGGGGGPVNTAPTAQLTATPGTVAKGGTVTLDASGSKDADGTIAKYAFDCGDASTATVNRATATCTYAKAGDYTASVTVTDDQGATAAATAKVSVTAATADQPPTAELVGGRVHRGQRIRIDASGSHANGDASIASYLFRCAGHWIGPKSGPHATCVFRKPGWHRVRVQVTDSKGLTDWASAAVRVSRSRRPVARLRLSDHVIHTGDSVRADAGRSHGFRFAPVTKVRFTCGNGQKSHWRKSRTYRCSFDKPGKYTVTVVVRNRFGQRDTASRVVRVRRG